MDIRQLTYFLAIIEQGSRTKAAERFHIAQPPLSHKLEVKLIERTPFDLEIFKSICLPNDPMVAISKDNIYIKILI
jgi:hypothetical protein